MAKAIVYQVNFWGDTHRLTVDDAGVLEYTAITESKEVIHTAQFKKIGDAVREINRRCEYLADDIDDGQAAFVPAFSYEVDEDGIPV